MIVTNHILEWRLGELPQWLNCNDRYLSMACTTDPNLIRWLPQNQWHHPLIWEEQRENCTILSQGSNIEHQPWHWTIGRKYAIKWLWFPGCRRFWFEEILNTSNSYPIYVHQQETFPSGRNGCGRDEWLRQSGRTPSKPSETPRWQITPRPASIPGVMLRIAFWTPFRRFFSLCQSPILNTHSGVVANHDHTSEWVHWVHTCIGIATQWVMQRKYLLTFLLH